MQSRIDVTQEAPISVSHLPDRHVLPHPALKNVFLKKKKTKTKDTNKRKAKSTCHYKHWIHPSFLVSVLFSQKYPEHSGNSKLSRQFYAYLKRCSVFILFASHKLAKAKSHEIICHINFYSQSKTLLLFFICMSNGCGCRNVYTFSGRSFFRAELKVLCKSQDSQPFNSAS